MRLAVIPARGGSKRIPRKNIKAFCGKPMIAYAIEAAKASDLFEHILVSSDDAEIQTIAAALGAEIPFTRPAELANDLREEVRKLIRQDKSDGQIKDYLVARYGDFVLYKPEVKPLTWVLWFGPFMLLAMGVIGMALYLRQRQSEQTARSTLSEEDRQKVNELLKSGEAP